MQTSQKARVANGKFQSNEEMEKPQCSGLALFDSSDDSLIQSTPYYDDDIETIEVHRLTLTVENWLWRILSDETSISPFFEIKGIPKVEFKICTKLTEYGGIAVVFRGRTNTWAFPCSATLIVTASVLTPAREELYVTSKMVTPFHWQSVTHLTLFNPYTGDEECLRHDDLKIRIRIAKVTDGDDAFDTSFHVRESERTSLGMPKRDRWTDLTLVTDDGASFPVHRFILAAVSPFFLAMLTTDMAEKGKKEIRLREVGSDALEALLELIYSGALPKDLAVPTYVEVYALADRYLMPDLYQTCLDYIEEKMRPTNVTSVLPLLHFHWDESLGLSALELVAENAGKVLKSPSWKEAEEHFPELCHKFLDFATRIKNRFAYDKEMPSDRLLSQRGKQERGETADVAEDHHRQQPERYEASSVNHSNDGLPNEVSECLQQKKRKKAKSNNKVQKKDFLQSTGQALMSATCTMFRVAVRVLKILVW